MVNLPAFSKVLFFLRSEKFLFYSSHAVRKRGKDNNYKAVKKN